MRVASHAHANPSFTMSMMSGFFRRQKGENRRSLASSFVLLQLDPPCFAKWLRRATRLRSKRVGGAERDRTDDLKLAKLALSQLSYSPV